MVLSLSLKTISSYLVSSASAPMVTRDQAQFKQRFHSLLRGRLVFFYYYYYYYYYLFYFIFFPTGMVYRARQN